MKGADCPPRHSPPIFHERPSPAPPFPFDYYTWSATLPRHIHGTRAGIESRRDDCARLQYTVARGINRLFIHYAPSLRRSASYRSLRENVVPFSTGEELRDNI